MVMAKVTAIPVKDKREIGVHMNLWHRLIYSQAAHSGIVYT